MCIELIGCFVVRALSYIPLNGFEERTLWYNQGISKVDKYGTLRIQKHFCQKLYPI